MAYELGGVHTHEGTGQQMGVTTAEIEWADKTKTSTTSVGIAQHQAQMECHDWWCLAGQRYRTQVGAFKAHEREAMFTSPANCKAKPTCVVVKCGAIDIEHTVVTQHLNGA